MVSSAKTQLRHALYYQSLLKSLGDSLSQGDEHVGLLAKNRFYLELEQFIRGQSHAANATTNQEDLLELCISYANSVYILALYLDKPKQIKWLENAIYAARILSKHNYACLHVIQLAAIYELLGDKKRAYSIYIEAFEFAIKYHLLDFFPDIWCRLADIESSQSQYKKAKRHYKNALTFLITEEQLPDRINCLVSLGEVEVKCNNFQEASVYFDKAYDYSLRLSNKLIMAELQHELGQFYVALGSFEKALISLKESISNFDEINNWRNKRHVLMSIGHVYKELKRHSEAEAVYLQAISISQQINDQFIMIGHQLILANFFLELRRFKEAETKLNEITDMLEHIDNLERRGDIALTWAKIFIAQSEISLAIPHLFFAEEVFEELEINRKLEFTRNLMQEYKPKGIFMVIGIILFTFNLIWMKAKRWFQLN